MKTSMIFPFSALALAGTIALSFGAKVGKSERESLHSRSAPSQLKPPIDARVSPINSPSEFAWRLFLYVNAYSKWQDKLTIDGKKVATNAAEWETWADDPLTFPENPNPKKPPVWPSAENNAGFRHKRLQPSHKVREGEVRLLVSENSEEILRNKSAFHYIINNDLWYREGLSAAFKKGIPLSMPTDSLAIKANWAIIKGPIRKSQYHWNYDENGRPVQLVAMHITSKVLPNWFWASFEWVGNPGRSDYIGSRDNFGTNYGTADKPSFNQQPNDQKTNQIYRSGQLTPQLEKLFQRAGFQGAWAAEWKNYRLKGTQVDFTDATGLPTLLGNSVIENGFVTTSSCMTCHARAAVLANGSIAFRGSGFKPLLPTDVHQRSYNGAPDPSWFWRFSESPQPERLALQTDFLWGPALLAHSVKKQ